MATVDLSVTLKASAQKVRELIGGFGSLAPWHPAVAKSEETKEAGATHRHPSSSRSRAAASSSNGWSGTTIARGPTANTIVSLSLPVAGYRSELSVREEGPQSCTVRWTSTFEPKGRPEAQAVGAASIKQGSTA
jgi:hypothetical protein